MKTKLFFIVQFFIVFTIGTLAQIPPNVPASGLVAWYALNGNGTDSGPNALHGSLVNTAPTQDRNLTNNSATYFYGSSEIDCGNDPAFNLDNCSFSAWVNVSKTNVQYQMILAKYDSVPGSYAFYLLGNKVGIEYTINSTTVKNIASISTLAINTWYHVVATHDAATGIKLYVNGVLKASDPLAFSINPGPDHFRIGSQSPSLPLPIKAGRLDDIGIWNRALTQTEITNLYSGCNVSLSFSPSSRTGVVGNSVFFICKSTAPSVTYQWQIEVGGGFQNLSNSGQYNGTTTDSLKVANLTLQNNLQKYRCVISSNGCSRATLEAYLLVNNNVGFVELDEVNAIFTLFPNPFHLSGNLVFKSLLKNAELFMYNSIGERVRTITGITGTMISIDRGNLSAGIYYFELLENSQEQCNGKFIIIDY